MEDMEWNGLYQEFSDRRVRIHWVQNILVDLAI